MTASHADACANVRAQMAATCLNDLNKAFAAWLLREPEQAADFASIADRASKMEGADQDFQTAALLGFAAEAGLLSEPQFATLKRSLQRLVGRNPVINGVPMAFCGDAVGVLGVVVGTRALSDADVTSQMTRWATKFLRTSYEREGGEEWQRCVFAAAGRHLDKSLDFAIPESAATADVRTALLSRGLIEIGDGDHARGDAVRTLALAGQEPPTNLTHDRAALRLAAFEFVMRTRPPADKGVPLTRMDGSIEWIDSQPDQAGRPLEPSATDEQTESARRTEPDRRTGVFGTAGHPKARPTGGGFAADPRIRKLVEDDPKALPLVNLVAQFEQARAQGEVVFRQSELKGRWGEWSGVFPWEGKRDPDTTDCPWWVAGAEYVFQLAAAWRKYSPCEREKIETFLPKQIEMSAEWVYQSKVRLHDIMRGKSSNAEHILIGHSKRFFNNAFLFSMQKFAEIDLDEWRDQATRLGGAITDLNSASTDQSAPQPEPGVSPPAQAKKPGRRNQKYKAIDEALQKIAESRPRTQEAVFSALEGRVGYPPAEPFESARGWMAGFGRDPRAARAWLSKRWGELDLPAFARGPKKRKQ